MPRLPTLLGIAAILLHLPASLSAGARDLADSAPRPVLATANIFGAGYGDAPAPGGGGGGSLAPGWRLPVGSSRVVTFASVAGKVSPMEGSTPFHGPQGDRAGSTDITSWRGISGIVHGNSGLFLVGVFLTDGEPKVPARPRLDFTRQRFGTLAPLVGQTFFIGDGDGRRYEVPDTATRLYVGFADAYNGAFYHGQPGYYGNNRGRLEVVASGVLDGNEGKLDTTPPELHGARNKTVIAPHGKARARVRFSVSAVDAVDGAVPVSCKPPSGGLFRVGRTRVGCSAVDSSDNTRTTAFMVTVRGHRR